MVWVVCMGKWVIFGAIIWLCTSIQDKTRIKSMNKLLIFVLLISQSFISYSQNYICTTRKSECDKLLFKGFISESSDDKYQKAIEIYKEAIQKDSTCCDAYNFLGAAYSMNGEFDKAIKVYIESLSISPHNYMAYSRLGQIYLHIGLTKESIDFYQEGLTVDPDNLNLLQGLSYAFIKDNNYQDAFVTINKALERVYNSNNREEPYALIYKTAGIIHYIRGEKKSSIDCMLIAFEFLKRDPELNYYMGKYYDSINSKKAKLYFKRALNFGYKIEDSILSKYELKYYHHKSL